ncbi:MAG: adenosine deaminase [Candidatus Omnitrophica bacterium]|nr:adenosine deaminase [Candidatus Omnitrophota bacterium]
MRSQPKAELHVHLLGAIRPETALSIAEKNRIGFPVNRVEDWILFFTKGDLAVFVEGFIALFEIIRTEEDFYRVAMEAAEDWSRDGVAYTEPRLTLTSHLDRGLSFETIFGGLDSARSEAKDRFGIEIRWIVDFPRILGVETGYRALDAAVRGIERGVIGFDIAGYEGPYGTDSEWRELFLEARRRGLHVTAHSGEVGSAAHVRTAVESWNVERIGHGVRAAEDESVMALLTERGVPLEICPTCNVLLGNVPALSDHPIELFRQRGIPVTLNTDDPSLFGISLSEEIFRAAQTFRWDREVVTGVIKNAWDHRFVGESESG